MANLVPKVNNTGSLGTSAKKWSNVHTTTLSVGAQASALSLNSQKITNLATPTASADAATKAYVDDAVQGLSAKDSVRAATTANGTLASAFANGQTVDGVTLATGDRVLLKNQTAGAENGIYTVNASGAPTRAVDFDANAEVAKGAFIFVEEGTSNANAGFVLTTDGAITLGTTALAFTQFSGAGQITAGDGLAKSGNTLSVDISGQTAETSIADDDLILVSDTSASGALRKMTKANFVSGLGGLSNIIEDTTPQLGGNLDVNDKGIGAYSGSGDIVLITSPGVDDAAVQIVNQGRAAKLEIYYNASNYVGLKASTSLSSSYDLILPAADGSANQVLKTDGSGNLSWTNNSGGVSNIVEDTTPQLGGSLDVNGQDIVTVSNGNITLTPNGSGIVRIDGTSGIDLQSGEIAVKNSGSVSNIKLYCEVGNAHYTQIQSAAHGSYSGNVTLTLPVATGTLVGSGDTGTVTNTMLAGSIANAKLANSAVTVTAGDGLSGGGSVALGATTSLALDLNELTAASVDVANDSIVIIDANDSNASKKESVADLVAGVAGTGLSASSGQLSIDGTVTTLAGSQTLTNKTLTSPVLNTGVSGTAVLDEDDMNSNSATKLATQQSIKAYVDAQVAGGGLNIDGYSALGGTGLHQTQDHFVFSDNGTEKKITFSNLEDAIFANITGDATIAAGGALTIGANAVEGSMLNNNTISGQTEMTGDVADADELLISDAGTLKRADFSVVRDAVFNDVSGDATVAAGGALSLSSAAITGQTAETSIANDDLILISDTSASGALRKITKANFISGLGGGTLSNVVEDTTPQLGGSLDVNSQDIVSTSNGNITLTPNGSGVVRIDGTSGIDLQSGEIAVKNSGSVSNIKLYCEVGNAHYTQIQSAAHGSYSGNVTLTLPTSTGTLVGSGDTGTVTNAMLAGSITASKMNNAIFADLETLGAPASDGQFIVATGSGAFAYESANTARTSLGLGTGDSPTFTSLTLSGQAAALAMNSQKITGLATPTADGDAATKSYVDSVAQGLSAKDAVRVATTANGTLSSAFANGQTVDGITLATGDRILIKNQTAGAANGIYTVNASGAPTRAVDFDANAEVAKGAYVFVEEGTTNADAGFVLTTDGAITLGTTALAFTQFSGAGDITAGDALTKSGNTLNVAVDDSSIEVSADALRVKASGITSAMLAGSIANSKLNTISTANKVALSSLDLDGGTDIGADLVDADLVIVDDGAGGTNRKSALSRMKKYIFSAVSGDATASDAGALTIASGAVETAMVNANVLTGQTAETSIADDDLVLIYDTSATALRKMTKANFVSGLSGATAADDISTGDAAVTIATSSGNITLDAQGSDTDIIFKGTDGGSDTTFLTLDGSAAGAATFNAGITAGGALLPSAADTHALGSASAEWADLYLGDSSNIYFGNDQDVKLTHNPDNGLIIEMTNDGISDPTLELKSAYSSNYGGPFIKLNLDSPSPAVNDVIGGIRFYGDDSGGTSRQFGLITCQATDLTGSADHLGRITIGVQNTAGTGSNPMGLQIEGVSGSSSKVKVNVSTHNGSDSGLHLGGTLVTATAAELNILDGVTATATELNLLDGGTSVGSSITVADADGFIVNDAGTMKTIPASDLKTYIGAGAADDLTTGDAAVTLATSSGNITIDAQGNDTDIIFKGTDNNSDITMLTLDGSEAGDATFNRNVTVTGDIILDDGGSIKEAGGTAAITIDASGEVTKIGQDSPSDGQFLQWDGSNSKVVWAAASGGGSQLPPEVKTVSSAATLSLTPSNASTYNSIEVIYTATGSSAYTVTLPTAASIEGKKIHVKRLATANITVDGDGSETIDGSATFVLTSQYSSITVISDGTNWIII